MTESATGEKCLERVGVARPQNLCGRAYCYSPGARESLNCECLQVWGASLRGGARRPAAGDVAASGAAKDGSPGRAGDFCDEW